MNFGGQHTLVAKMDNVFGIFVMSAVLKIDSKLIKRHLEAKKIRFATSQELLEITGLVPGSIPPFGNVFNIDLYIDISILEQEKIAFNAGSLTTSIVMNSSDYIKVSKPTEIFKFTQNEND